MASRRDKALQQFLELPEAERRLGPYRLVRRLGKGGYAPVWLASETYGDTEVRVAAVKLFPLGDDKGLSASGKGAPRAIREQVAEEARLLSRVEHPNVVRFYALAFDEARGLAGLAMEYAVGESAQNALDRHGVLPVVDALEIGIAVASALAAIHRAGLVHRDVKPANVVRSGGLHKLIDFGIAAAEGAARACPAPVAKAGRSAPPVANVDDLPLLDEDLPAAAPIAVAASPRAGREEAMASGTLGYVDPEIVADGVRAVPASDLYGLGALLFEILTGKLPAGAASTGAGPKAEVLDGRASAPPLLGVRADVPPMLARLIDQLLAPLRVDRPKSADFVAHELERIRRTLAGHGRKLPPEAAGPFRGLGRFEGADRDLLFGRTVEQAAAIELLRTRSVVTLLGPSGSGKSSLARAAIVPAVAEGALGGWPTTWETHVLTPGADPHAALLPLVEDASLSPEGAVVRLAERVQARGVGVLIFLDQFEELVTLADGESSSWLARFVARVAEQGVFGLRVIVAVRRDLFDEVLAVEGLGSALVRGTLFVAPLADRAWGEVLDGALGAYSYSFEDRELRAEILGELAGMGDAMPLVQFALAQLWETRDSAKKLILRSGLREIGGMGGALERHAEQTLASLVAEYADAVAVARDVLLALTTAQGTRTIRPAAEVVVETGHGFAARVLKVLEDARLLVREPAGVTLAHEALLSHWSRLSHWLSEARDDRHLAAELTRDAEQWEKTEDATLLWKKRRLLAAQELIERGALRVSASVRAFIGRARAEERRGRLLLGAVAAALIVAGVGVAVQRVRDERVRLAAAEAAGKNERELRESAERAQHDAEGAKREAERARKDAEDAKKEAEDAKRRLSDMIASAKDLHSLQSSAAAARTVHDAPATPQTPEQCRSACAAGHEQCMNACRGDRHGQEATVCWDGCDVRQAACLKKCK